VFFQLKGVLNKDGNPATPHELFTGEKPCISDFRVFGCPVVVKKYVARIDGNATSNQTQRGIRGIFIGFPRNQKGFLVFVPSTRQIVVSGDVVFDETFYCAIATTWRPFHDSLALRPISSNAPTGDMTVEETGTIDDVFPSLQEGTLPNFTADEEDSDTDASDNASILSYQVEEGNPPTLTADDDESPLVVDDSVGLRRSARSNKGKGASKLTFSLFQRD